MGKTWRRADPAWWHSQPQTAAGLLLGSPNRDEMQEEIKAPMLQTAEHLTLLTFTVHLGYRQSKQNCAYALMLAISCLTCTLIYTWKSIYKRNQSYI